MVKAFALLLLWPSLAFAADAVPVIDRPVVDQAGLLSAQDQEKVASALVGLRNTKGAQMAVLIVETTSGEPIEDYSIRVARQWRGGQGGANNGLLYVLAVKDRRMRLDVGYGLEEFLPDDAVRSLLDAQLPLMRQKDFTGAIVHIIEGVGERLPASDSAATASSAPGSGSVPSGLLKDDKVMHDVLVMGVIALLLCAIALRPGVRERMSGTGVVLICGGLLAAPMIYALGRTAGDSGLAWRVVPTLVLGAGLFFLGQNRLVKSDWIWSGACLMLGSLLALVFTLWTPRGSSILSLLILTLMLTLGVMFASFIKVGDLFLLPWMYLVGGGQIVQQWRSPTGARSYSSGTVGTPSGASSPSVSASSPSTSVSSSASSVSTAWPWGSTSSVSSWWNSSSSSSSSSDSSSSSSSSWDSSSSSSSSWDSSSSSSSSWDSSSSSSSSWDSSSSSSSSWDSSSSSSSSSSSTDWSGGGGDFGGGGSSSSW